MATLIVLMSLSREAVSQSESAPSLVLDPEVRIPAADQYDIIALRIEFQPDSSRFTTGNGTFGDDIYAGLEVSVDPLPHDSSYFQAHLEGLANYVAKVSDGKTEVRGHVIPEVVRLSQPMSAYSPTGPNADSREEQVKLARMIDEAWETASRQVRFNAAGFDPTRTAFILFHAGAGRDIELIGQPINLDKTPEDIPSLYFDPVKLRSFRGPRPILFKGLPVFSTIILPETETRLGSDGLTGEPFALELSIRGLLIASFFNFLGAPDLFDTETGNSAIGPFGLMDPLGFFAYRGLLPPKPSIWTRYFLGWVEPEIVTAKDETTVSLSATPSSTHPEAVRVPISGSEFFLVENRFRDPAGDGLRLTVLREGQIVEEVHQAGESTFSENDISGFGGGVILDVDDIDWSIPYGIDENENDLNGGVLIWHIDNRVIFNNYADGTVNANSDFRGVDLEEADGSQDMGFAPPGAFDTRFDLGHPFDFWFASNAFRVITRSGDEIQFYQNRFGPDTTPSSDASRGGDSFVELYDFEDPAEVVSFKIRSVEGASGSGPVPGVSRDLATGAATFTNSVIKEGRNPDAWSVFLEANEEDVTMLKPRTYASVVVNEQGQVDTRSGLLPITGAALSDGRLLWTRASEAGELEFIAYTPFADSTEEVLGTLRSSRPRFDPGESSGRGAIVIREESGLKALAGIQLDEGYIIASLSNGNVVPAISSRVGELIGLVNILPENELLVVTETEVIGWEIPHRWTLPTGGRFAPGSRPMFGRDRSGIVGVVPALLSGSLFFLEEISGNQVVTTLQPAEIPTGSSPSLMNCCPTLVDLDGDGLLDILTSYKAELLGISRVGTPIDGFPKMMRTNMVGPPAVVRFSGHSDLTALLPLSDGQIHAIPLGSSDLAPQAFPLPVGGSLRSSLLVSDGRVSGVSVGSSFRSWTIPDIEEIWVGEAYVDASNSSFVVLPDSEGPNLYQGRLLAESDVYNWPNPIRDGLTHFSFNVSERSDVTIRIADLSGMHVETIDVGSVLGGFRQEYTWETSLPSGVYVAKLEARGESGALDSIIIRMAVIR